MKNITERNYLVKYLIKISNCLNLAFISTIFLGSCGYGKDYNLRLFCKYDKKSIYDTGGCGGGYGNNFKYFTVWKQIDKNPNIHIVFSVDLGDKNILCNQKQVCKIGNNDDKLALYNDKLKLYAEVNNFTGLNYCGDAIIVEEDKEVERYTCQSATVNFILTPKKIQFIIEKAYFINKDSSKRIYIGMDSIVVKQQFN
jgi:hypothetical protein